MRCVSVLYGSILFWFGVLGVVCVVSWDAGYLSLVVLSVGHLSCRTSFVCKKIEAFTLFWKHVRVFHPVAKLFGPDSLATLEERFRDAAKLLLYVSI